MSFVITGATGGLGRRVVEVLLDRGVAPEQIVAGGRDETRLAELAESGVRATVLDYDRPETISAALEGAESVLLVSGSSPGERVEQHRRVIEAAAAASVPRFAYTSVLRADTTTNVLAPDHVATEAIIRESGLAATILRNGWYADGYIAQVQNGIRDGVISAAAGSGRIASAPRDEYAEAAAIALLDPESEGRVFELCGDTEFDFADLAAIASRAGGREVAYEAVSADERLTQLQSAGLDDGLAGFLVRLETDVADGCLAGGPRDLSALLGRPTTTIEQTISAQLDAVR